MKVAVISDLHIGTNDMTDQFGHSSEEFLDFLNYLESNFDRIVLLGDIYECLMPQKLFCAKNKIAKCFKAYPIITKKIFSSPKYIYIAGNHDYIVSSLYNVHSEYLLKADSHTILFQHGHQQDAIIAALPKLCETIAYGLGHLMRNDMSTICSALQRVERALHDDGYVVSKFHLKTKKAAERLGADVVVTGHTHVLRKIQMGNVLYLNSGSCSRGEFNYIDIDTKKSEFNIYDFWEG